MKLFFYFTNNNKNIISEMYATICMSHDHVHTDLIKQTLDDPLLLVNSKCN